MDFLASLPLGVLLLVMVVAGATLWWGVHFVAAMFKVQTTALPLVAAYVVACLLFLVYGR